MRRYRITSHPRCLPYGKYKIKMNILVLCLSFAKTKKKSKYTELENHRKCFFLQKKNAFPPPPPPKKVAFKLLKSVCCEREKTCKFFRGTFQVSIRLLHIPSQRTNELIFSCHIHLSTMFFPYFYTFYTHMHMSIP